MVRRNERLEIYVDGEELRIQVHVTGNTEHSTGIQHERKVTVAVSLAHNEDSSQRIVRT